MAGTQSEQALGNLAHAQEALAFQIMMLGNLAAWAEGVAKSLAEEGIGVANIRVMDGISDLATTAQDAASTYGMKLEDLHALIASSFSR